MRQVPTEHTDTGTGKATRSIWMRESQRSHPDKLGVATNADVCVIGAGIAGLTSAYRFLLEGRKVIVVDGGSVGGGETLRTTAHLANALDDRFEYLERHHGAEGARILATSHGYAIDWIESLVREHGIACDFERVDGYLFNGTSQSRTYLERELAASRRAGLSATLVERLALGSFSPGPCIQFHGQAQFDPGAYLAALAQLVIDRGGAIHEGVVVERIEEGAPVRVVIRDGRTITAADVVVATNAPITSLASLPLKQAAYRSYVVTLELPSGELPAGLYWDTDDPYHYVRVARGRGRSDVLDGSPRDVVILGGEDHKTGQEDEALACYDRLYAWAAPRFPNAIRGPERWSGQIMEPADGVGFVGRNPGSRANIFVISGDSGNGLTLGTLAANIVTDLAAGRPNAWAHVYDPSRMVRAAGTFLSENANVARQYLDLVAPGEIESSLELANGRGAVLRDGAKLNAVYRDELGALHVCSAICPHLGGVVHWNEVEKSWDCPCHGSRFDPRGRVINGPATSDLKPRPGRKSQPQSVVVGPASMLLKSQ